MVLVQNFYLQMEPLEKISLFLWADMNSSMYIDDRNKNISILGEESKQGLDDTTLTAEAK